MISSRKIRPTYMLQALLVCYMAVMSFCLAAAPNIFRDYCSACHGEDGNGGNMGGPSLVLKPSQEITDSELSTTIREGRPENGMPSFMGSLTSAEIEEVVAYIGKLQRINTNASNGSEQPAAESVAKISAPETRERPKGELLFFGEAGCSYCHSILKRGGRTAPDLTKLEQRMSREQIVEAIRTPSDSISPRYEVREVETRDGEVIRGWSRTNKTPSGSFQLYNVEESLWTTYFIPELRSYRVIPESLMPEGLLEGLSQQQVEDILDYLMSSKHLQ
jgi:putative heme-binding domain-containing protein